MSIISAKQPQPPGPLRSWTGTLSRELALTTGEFGLGQVPERLKPDATTTVVCGYCSTGCGLNVHLKSGQGLNLTPSTHYPVNLGMACPKGWEALTPLSAPDRATTPLLRNAKGHLEPVDWHTAMTVFTERFKALQQKHGAESVAWLGTGQICTEELAFLGAFAKFGMGMIHGDGNTRQCMATAVVAYKQSFGFDAPPYTYKDFEESDVIVLIGSNLTIAHPILWQRVLRNPHHPEIIVVDPRKTETAMAATQHYAILPKSDLTLLYGIANLLIQNGWLDEKYIQAHTQGFAEFKSQVREFTPAFVTAATGLTVGQLYRFAESIHRGKRVSFWWTMGVNQGHQAVRTAQAIINIALMTGNMGRPGTGANSITGQCNAMGSRLFSNTTNLLGGHSFTDARDRAKVANILGIPEDCIPAVNSLAYDEILEGIRSGKIRGLWMVATNTAHSWIDQKGFREVLEKLEFFVVQDMYHTTETAVNADLVLPAAGWGEKEGTFINSERRFGLIKKISKAPGQALSDFNIVRLATKYWGCAELFEAWDSPENVFQILKKLSAGQPCDITGIEDYRMLDDAGGIQWPFPANRANALRMGDDSIGSIPAHSSGIDKSGNLNLPSVKGESGREVVPDPSREEPSASEFLRAHPERRLFEDGVYFHPDGKARFYFEDPEPPQEPVDQDFPFALLTGRGTSAQWHTQTRTSKSEVLRMLYPPSAYIEIAPVDAQRLGILPNSLVRISSRRGSVMASAFLSPTVRPGQIFMPMHYAETNQLTLPSFDRYSRQPSYKHCAVRIEALSEPANRAVSEL